MSDDPLTTYLNDHLAGSRAAVELLDHLTALYSKGRNEAVFSTLRSEVEDDRKLLQRLIHDVGGSERRGRSAIAWLTEKLIEMKLDVDDPAGLLHVFEAVELLELGAQGKREGFAPPDIRAPRDGDRYWAARSLHSSWRSAGSCAFRWSMTSGRT